MDATLQRAGIDASTLQRLANRRLVTPRDVLSTLPLDLMELLDLPLPAVEALVRAVAAALLPQPVTALDLARMKLAQPSHLPTQLEGLDSVMRGGCACGSLTEVVGPAGVGKTQLCLQLAAIAACLQPSAPDAQPGAVCYIDSERRFSAKRFMEIVMQRFPGQHAGHTAQESPLRRVQVSTPQSATDLLQELQALEGGRAARDNVRLVVVDSIAALVRHEMDRHVADKQQLLGHQAATLKSLAERCNIPIVVSNQITTAFQLPMHTFEAAPPQGQGGGGGYLTAALGPQWAHAVNTRLVLEAHEGVRWIKVAKSPVAPMVAFAYEIGGAGLQLLDRDPVSAASVGGTLALPISNEMF